MPTRSSPRWSAPLAALCLLAAACGRGGGSADAPASTLVAITLTPDQITLALGTGKKFTALAWYSDGSSADVSGEVVWSVQNSIVASVFTQGPKTGRVKAVGLGTTQVLATHTSGVSGSAPVQVTPAVLVALTVTPTAPSIALGTTQQLAAVGPLMSEVAGEVADGVIAHGFTTATYLRDVTLPAVQRGLEIPARP